MKINYRRFFIFLIILIAAVVLASYMGGPFPYMCLFSMLFYLPFSAVYIFISNYFFRVYQELPSRRVMKNENQPYTLTIENAGIIRINDAELVMEKELTTFDLEPGTFNERSEWKTVIASDRTGSENELGLLEEEKNADSEDKGDKPALNLTPGERVNIHGVISCKYAGIYDVGLISVKFTDPFMLYEASFSGPSSYRVTVMPRITDVANDILDFENMKNSSRIKSAVLREPVPANEIRHYRPGDPLKQIHWKASASAGELISRIPEALDLRKISLILIAEKDTSKKYEPGFIKRRDCFLEFAVSAVYYHVQKGESIQVIYPRGEIKSIQVGSPEGFAKFYEDISKGPFYNKVGDFETIEAQKASMAENDEDAIIITVRESEYGNEHFLGIRNCN